MQAVEILEQLVAFPSVVGQANGAIVEWIRAYVARFTQEVTILPGPEGDRSNLFATIGPKNVPAMSFQATWTWCPPTNRSGRRNPFVVAHRRADRLYGRGTSDMKGFLAAALAALPQLASRQLSQHDSVLLFRTTRRRAAAACRI